MLGGDVSLQKGKHEQFLPCPAIPKEGTKHSPAPASPPKSKGLLRRASPGDARHINAEHISEPMCTRARSPPLPSAGDFLKCPGQLRVCLRRPETPRPARISWDRQLQRGSPTKAGCDPGTVPGCGRAQGAGARQCGPPRPLL